MASGKVPADGARQLVPSSSCYFSGCGFLRLRVGGQRCWAQRSRRCVQRGGRRHDGRGETGRAASGLPPHRACAASVPRRRSFPSRLTTTRARSGSSRVAAAAPKGGSSATRCGTATLSTTARSAFSARWRSNAPPARRSRSSSTRTGTVTTSRWPGGRGTRTGRRSCAARAHAGRSRVRDAAGRRSGLRSGSCSGTRTNWPRSSTGDGKTCSACSCVTAGAPVADSSPNRRTSASCDRRTKRCTSPLPAQVLASFSGAVKSARSPGSTARNRRPEPPAFRWCSELSRVSLVPPGSREPAPSPTDVLDAGSWASRYPTAWAKRAGDPSNGLGGLGQQ